MSVLGLLILFITVAIFQVSEAKFVLNGKVFRKFVGSSMATLSVALGPNLAALADAIPAVGTK